MKDVAEGDGSMAMDATKRVTLRRSRKAHSAAQLPRAGYWNGIMGSGT